MDDLKIKLTEPPKIKSPSDVMVREANIFMLTRNVKDVDLTPKSFQHWILEAEFPNNRTLYFEADSFKNKLTPFVFENFNFAAHAKQLGKVKTSPFRLMTFAYKNRHNNKSYTFLINNCQVWVKELCANIGLDVPEETFAEILGRMGIVASVLFGLPGTVVSLAGIWFMNQCSSAGSYNSSRRTGSK